MLTSEGIHGGIGHALSQMVALLPDENALKSQLALLAPLAAYATTYRYPTSSRVPKAPAERDLAPHFENLERVLAQASQRFGVDFDAPGTAARSPAPPR